MYNKHLAVTNNNGALTPTPHSGNTKLLIKPKRTEKNTEYSKIELVKKTKNSEVIPSDKDAKRELRKQQNKEYARKSRESKKNELLSLQSENEQLKQHILVLTMQNDTLKQENESLKGVNAELNLENHELKKCKIGNQFSGHNDILDAATTQNNMGFMEEENRGYYEQNLLFFSPLKNGKQVSSEQMNGYFI